MAYRSKFKRDGAVAKYKNSSKILGERMSIKIPQDLGSKRTLNNGPLHIPINKRLCPLYSLRYQPVPVNDYLNFK